MLARSQAGRLCSRCRTDLLALFERGICDPKTAARHRFPPTTIRLQSRLQRREFTCSTKAFQNGPAKSKIQSSLQNDSQPVQEAGFTAEEIILLKRLKELLNKDDVDTDQLEAVAAETQPLFAAAEEDTSGLKADTLRDLFGPILDQSLEGDSREHASLTPDQLVFLTEFEALFEEEEVEEDRYREFIAKAERLLEDGAVEGTIEGDQLRGLIEEAELVLEDSSQMELQDQEAPVVEGDSSKLLRERLQDHDSIDEPHELVDESVETEEAIALEPTPSDESLIALRAEGVSPLEIAREARQVFGERLPDNILRDDEIKIYKRLYDRPLPELERAEQDDEANIEIEDVPRGELVDKRGKLIRTNTNATHDPDAAASRPAEFLDSALEHRASSVAQELDAEYNEDEFEFLNEEDIPPHERAHPLTALGKAGTRPSTVYLPKAHYAEPVQSILADYSNSQLKTTSERTFGGPGLPDSPLTPRSSKSRKQVPVSLQASQIFMGEMEANSFITSVIPPAFAAITSVLTETRKRLGQTWLTELLSRAGGPRVLDAGAGGAGILAWNEVMTAHWQSLHSSDANPPPPPPSKTVVLTGSDPLRHRSAALLENTTFIPRLPDYVHTRDRPTIDDDRITLQRKQFDVIISSYSLLPFKEDWERKQYVQNLWTLLSPSGGILILIEKGMPRGFEAIAGARDMLLERYIAAPTGHSTQYTAKHHDDEDSVHTPTTSMIVAPCTNHEKCPMYRIPGESRGRKDFCSFQQRYIRPPQLQRILGAKDRNHDDVDFSYISVMKGHDLRDRQFSNWNHLSDPLSAIKSSSGAEAQSEGNTESWVQACQTGFASTTTESIADTSSTGSGLPPTHLLPRLVFAPIKRQGHILLDVCTPSGTLERWTVPRSFSKQAFRDARKAQWGDIWALGAKTRVPRKIRVGADSQDNEMARSKNERQRQKAQYILERQEDEREEAMEAERVEGEDMDQEVDEWENELREVQREFKTISADIVNQVWQDIGAGEVEQPSTPPAMGSENILKHPREPLKPSKSPRAHPKPSPRTSEPVELAQPYAEDAEDAITKQLLADWEAELQEEKAMGRSTRTNQLTRSTKASTRETKRKYRELKRTGDVAGRK